VADIAILVRDQPFLKGPSWSSRTIFLVVRVSRPQTDYIVLGSGSDL
jgi:hypothetical protein